MKSKYKKVVPQQNEYPVGLVYPLPGSDDIPKNIYINSDGNILTLLISRNDIHTYTYTQSNTKLGNPVTFTTENLMKFIETNLRIPRTEFQPVTTKTQQGCKNK